MKKLLLILAIFSLAGSAFATAGKMIVNASQSTKLTTGLYGHWTFDGQDIVGATAVDTGSGKKNATINGLAKVPGKMGQGLYWSGLASANPYVLIPFSSFSVNNSSFAFWVKASAGSGYFMDTGVGARFILASGIACNSICWYDTAAHNSGVALPVNRWVHLAYTFDTSANIGTMYLNGLAIGTSTIAAGKTLTSLYLGRYYGNAQNMVTGTMDDWRIYNRTLSASEVMQLYELGSVQVNASQNGKITSGLVGLWSFDGADMYGTTAYDRSGSGKNASSTTALMPSKVIGKLGQALSFNGAQYLSTTTGATLNSIKSVSFWAKPNTTTQPLLDINGSTINVGISSGTVQANGFTNPTIFVDGVSSSVFPNTNWHFVTITSNTAVNAIAFKIGRNTNGYYSGTLDDLRVYNRALSGSDVMQLYKLGQVIINKK